jgi:uncharacterized protein (TIGR02231 family)
MSAFILMLMASTSAPNSVVVFPDRAQVTRTTSIDCASRVPVAFTSIPPAAAMDSFRARVEGGTVDALRAELKSRAKEFNPLVETLEKQLESLGLEQRVLQNEMQRAQQQESVGATYLQLASQFVSREMSLEKPDTKNWHLAFENSLSSKMTAAKLSAETQKKLNVLERQREEVDLKLNNARGNSSKNEYVVEILATCSAGKKAQVSLTYLVGGTAWIPAYEARADESQNTVEFSTFATVTQGTGEDWGNVNLVLSTALPSQDATPPLLNKLIVGSCEKAPEKKVLVRRDEFVERADVGSSNVSDGTKSQAVAKSQGLSVQLEVPQASTVRGDSSPIRLFVGKTNMNAVFELRATPKLFPVAFRVALVTNQAQWPFLPGRLDVFRKTGMVGRVDLPRTAQGAPMTISLGIEDSIRIKRTVVQELAKDVGLFNDKKRFNYVYKFDVSNYGKSNAVVTVIDHLPVSEMADIAVSVSEKTTPGFELAKDDGLAKWKLNVKPNEKKTIDFGFRVDVPNSYELGGL